MPVRLPRARSGSAALAAAAAGFVVYGAWAAYANRAHGMAIALGAGTVQGAYSFVLTLAMSAVTAWVFGRFAHLRLRAAATVAVVSAALFTTAYTINALAGTPEIVTTILPGFVIGTVYTALYVQALSDQRPNPGCSLP